MKLNGLPDSFIKDHLYHTVEAEGCLSCLSCRGAQHVFLHCVFIGGCLFCFRPPAFMLKCRRMAVSMPSEPVQDWDMPKKRCFVWYGIHSVPFNSYETKLCLTLASEHLTGSTCEGVCRKNQILQIPRQRPAQKTNTSGCFKDSHSRGLYCRRINMRYFKICSFKWSLSNAMCMWPIMCSGVRNELRSRRGISGQALRNNSHRKTAPHSKRKTQNADHKVFCSKRSCIPSPVCIVSGLFLCVYRYLYVFSSEYISLFVFLYMYVNNLIYIYMYICMYACMYVCMHVYMYVCMYVCLYTAAMIRH